MTGPKVLLNIQEASEITGYAVSTLYKMARRGDIPARIIGRNVRFVPKEIDGWITRQRKAGT